MRKVLCCVVRCYFAYLATSTGRSLDHYRIADGTDFLDGIVCVPNFAFEARNDEASSLLSHLFAVNFVTHSIHCIAGRSDEN